MCVASCIELLIVAFLMGGIPFGLLLSRAFSLPDPRTIGSGNIGATNILRTGRKDIAALTLLLDGMKGVAAVWTARHLFEADASMAAVAMMVASAGHIYSPFLGFKGGKGVATTVGGALALSPELGLVLIGVWLLVFFTTRISSLSSIAMLSFMPILAWWQFDALIVLILAMTSLITVHKHLANVARLVKGEEPRVSFGGRKESS